MTKSLFSAPACRLGWIWILSLMLSACAHPQRWYAASEHWREQQCREQFPVQDPRHAHCLDEAQRDWDELQSDSDTEPAP